MPVSTSHCEDAQDMARGAPSHHLGSLCKLPQRGPGQSLGRLWISGILQLTRPMLLHLNLKHVFTTRCYAEHSYATVHVCRLSRCLCVCPSCRIAAHIDPSVGDLVQREHPKIRVEWGWAHEHKTCNILEMVQYRTKVTMTYKY